MTESLPKPKTIVDMVNRVGFLLAKEVQDYVSQFEAADVWDLTPPTGMNPSVSEGMLDCRSTSGTCVRTLAHGTRYFTRR